METKNNIAPVNMAIHPGEVLKEELLERGITQKTLAEMIGMRPSHLSELLNGKRSMTIAIADKLQTALGIDSQSWMNLQTQYNYDIKGQSCHRDSATLQVTIDDTTFLADIKRAISLLKGVGKVAIL